MKKLNLKQKIAPHCIGIITTFIDDKTIFLKLLILSKLTKKYIEESPYWTKHLAVILNRSTTKFFTIKDCFKFITHLHVKHYKFDNRINISKIFPNLQCLYILHHSTLEDFKYIPLTDTQISRIKTLKSLDLSNCENTVDSIKGLKNLIGLVIFNKKKDNMKIDYLEFPKFLPNLTGFHLRLYDSQFKEEALLPYASKLQYLTLKFIDDEIRDEREYTTFKTLEYFVNLKNLHLINFNITDEMFKDLSNLKVLKLDDVKGINGSFMKYTQKLKYLVCMFCKELTNICYANNSLELLKICECKNLNFDNLYMFKSLELLQVQGDNINDNQIEKSIKLKELYVFENNNFTGACIDKLLNLKCFAGLGLFKIVHCEIRKKFQTKIVETDDNETTDFLVSINLKKSIYKDWL